MSNISKFQEFGEVNCGGIEGRRITPLGWHPFCQLLTNFLRLHGDSRNMITIYTNITSAGISIYIFKGLSNEINNLYTNLCT